MFFNILEKIILGFRDIVKKVYFHQDISVDSYSILQWAGQISPAWIPAREESINFSSTLLCPLIKTLVHQFLHSEECSNSVSPLPSTGREVLKGGGLPYRDIADVVGCLTFRHFSPPSWHNLTLSRCLLFSTLSICFRGGHGPRTATMRSRNQSWWLHSPCRWLIPA